MHAKRAPIKPGSAVTSCAAYKVMPALEQLKNGGATLVYPHQQLCRPTCIVHLDGEILYSEGEHLTAAGAELLRPMFARALSSPARRSTTR